MSSDPNDATAGNQYVEIAIDRGVARVTFSNDPINLLDIGVLRELAPALRKLATDDDVRAVVLRSANPEWFIAHFDVAEILDQPWEAPAPTDVSGFQRMTEVLRTMPKPTIADIRGRVGGGGSEIALSCDMRFATPDAVFNQPEVALGILPGGSGTVRLPRLVGRGRALETILGCDDVDAATAERWGWINRMLPTDEIGEFVDGLAHRIASFPPAAVAAAKRSVIEAEQAVVDHLRSETAAFDDLASQPESQAAMRAFLSGGGQTPEGERRLGALLGDLGSPPA